MKLNELHDNLGSRKPPKRLGRGEGSGRGKTGGRGQKGQKSRSGVSLLGFEGGQMPLYRRVPKRGFNNRFRKIYEIINVGDLDDAIKDKKLVSTNVINSAAMLEAGLISGRKDGIKLLGMGTIKSKLAIEVDKASKAAIAAVEAAGGKVSLPEITKVEISSQKQSERRKAKREGRKVADDLTANEPDES